MNYALKQLGTTTHGPKISPKISPNQKNIRLNPTHVALAVPCNHYEVLPCVPGPSDALLMQPSQYAQVKALFAEVCDLIEPARSARLAALCDVPELIAEVHALINQSLIDAKQFAQPVLEVLAAVAGEELKPGDRLGVWTLTHELGHGGMGTVFQAQRGDGQFEQIAAIKVLRGMPSAPALARLSAERQIVANLAHPNIARLLDGGATPLGRPYLVLEYIEGLAIDRYCQRQRLSVEQIVTKMLEVCAGLSYAHQRLVVHCDLKPSNILVNRDGRPLLLDFGIAHRITEQGDTPEAGATKTFAYTPGYASPEQRAGGELTTATDVYSLGRVLASLLNPASAAESTALLTQVDVSAPSARTAAPFVTAPLAAIIAHATAQHPAQRYVSVSAMAEDLQRFLRYEPVSVIPNKLYRARCYVRRNALALVLGSIAVLALLGGLIFTGISLRQARAERARAELAAAQASRTADFLGNILSAADPDRARDLDTKLLREILDQAARQAQAQLSKEPLVLSQIEQVIGNTYYQLGAYEAALRHLENALALRLPEASYVRERLALREKIADSLGDAQSQRALRDYQQVYQERLAAFGASDPDTLKSSYALAFQLVRTGDFQSGVTRSDALQPILEKTLGPNDITTLANLQNIAVARTELAQFAIAESTLKTLVQRHIQLHGEAHSQTFAVQNSLVIFYLRQARFAEAEALLRQLLPVALKRLGPNNFKSLNFTALLASALRQNGKLQESGVYYRQALASATALYGEHSAITLRFASNYANFELANGDPAAALARLKILEPMLIREIGAEHPDMSDLYRTRAKALVALKQRDAARQSWQQALAIDRKAYGDDKHPLVLEDLAGLAAMNSDPRF
jgi:eukaryotic-like serine/threonine-protein kinase